MDFSHHSNDNSISLNPVHKYYHLNLVLAELYLWNKSKIDKNIDQKNFNQIYEYCEFSRLRDAFKIWTFWIPDRVTPEFGNDGATKSRARNKISRANNVHVR